MKGTVLWFNPEAGFGFLKNNEDGEEMYFHWSSIISDREYKTAFTGEPVEFERRIVDVNGGDKPEAVNVAILERISNISGKPILLIAYANLKGELQLKEIHYRISKYGNAGLNFVNECAGLLISSDHSLDNRQLIQVAEIIRANYDDIEENVKKGIRKVFVTLDTFEYDIIFL